MDLEGENPKNDRETEGKIEWWKKVESRVKKEMRKHKEN